MSKVAIIGAGMGGLAVAIRLAVAGHRVTVYERNARVGGKLNLLEQAGFRWDTGPSLITMPFVYRQLFEQAGKRLEDYVRLEPVEPICRYFWPDGTVFDASDSLARMTAAIERLNPADVNGYLRFLAYSRRLYDLTAEPFLFHGINSRRDFLKLKPRAALQIDPFRTVHQAVSSYFKDQRLVQLFDRYATYNGSSPYQAPATLNIIPYVELGMGGWYVTGGLYSLAQAYERLAGECGVDIQTGAEVTKIVIKNGRAAGLRLSGGVEISADIVVANTDVSYTNKTLLDQGKGLGRFLKRVELEPSCSGFVLFLGLNRQYDHLAHHNIFFSRDYRAEFKAIFNDRCPPDDPTIYVCWTGRTDPAHAPPGGSNLFILVNAPYLSPAFNWAGPGAAQGYRDLVVSRLQAAGLAGLEQAVVSEAMMTPLDIASRFNAERGAIYGLSSNNRFSAFLRPPNRSHRYGGLYFVGGSTHPGGGVPLVTLSAKIVSDLIAADL